ncbi:winged helix-turn-helix domain-containing protein [Shewanella sp. D64]|uniref:winged helix-turn-helix domain-containing protein n=1 Tax=unclassified Shewanella TaxID=196818 RepID=UPI0022BA666D|nr:MULTISPECIES: winged helix-turn-helix domain-containing protein [unclassified Shewanella]MEC4726692.1 winged helix-turn-helix domain-containing protein [Shewanella sp. D64]MEC4738944.1 winged helix-turn-helix domain-containing protein [Shewanella sp. E94]WBJ96905.1 winged helix-turn-helix domain-containing protein [Shewanella sp. MTB7]
MIEIKKEAVFKLGNCEVNPNDNSLNFSVPGGEEVELSKVSVQPKFIELLSYLARQYPRVVPRDELIDKIWEGNVYVGTKALTNAIWHLRKHLNPLLEGEQAIETVRKMGYRLLISPEFNESDLVDEPDLYQQEQAKVQNLTLYNRRLLIVSLTCFTIFCLVSVFHLYQDSIRYAPTELQRLTLSTGAELYPAVSPDGRWLVYSSRSNNRHPSLYLKDLLKPTETPKRLTSIKTSEYRAVWSPDGGALYYPSEHLDEDKCYLTVLNLDSNEASKLGSCYSDGAAIDISPDGKTLVYIWNEGNGHHSGIYQLDLTSKEAEPIRLSCAENCGSKDRDMAFSPDGKWIAIARRFGNISEDIFIRDTDTGEERRLTFGLEDIRGLSWHQDNERLIFSTDNSGVRNGYIVGIEDRVIHPLEVEGMSYPRSIPFSNELVYSNYMQDYQIASFALEQSIPTATFPLLQVEYSYRNPDYSEVAKRIVYVSNETGFNEIWSSDPDGESRQQHTDLKRRVAYPSWSHDGTKVAFLAPDDKNEGNKIHVLDINTSNISILATPYLDHNRPSWGWKDEMVLARTKDGITEFYLDNLLPKVISPINMRVGKMIDEDKFVFTQSGRNGLWSLSLSQPEVISEIISAKDFNVDYNWVATEKGIYFKKSHSRYQLINFWRFNTEQVTPILKLPSRSIPRLGAMTYIPDRNSLLITLFENHKRDVIKLKHKLLQ